MDCTSDTARAAGDAAVRQLVEAACDDALFVLDTAGTIIDWTPPAAALTGHAGDALRGVAWNDLLLPADRDAGQPARDFVTAAGRGRAVAERWYPCRGGVRFWARSVTVARRDAAGRLLGYGVALRDQTEQLARGGEPSCQSAQVRADAQRDAALATVAHEMRNPLSPLLTYAHVLQLQTGDPAVRAAAGKIETHARHLARLVDDLTTAAQARCGKLDLHRQPCDLLGIVARAVEMARPHIDAACHALTVDLPAELIGLDADADRLCQAVANLLGNAAKYTPRGGRITVQAGRDGDAAVVRVTDTGIGIAPHRLRAVFEPFVQEPQGKALAAGGLGVGLAVVREVAELHGGRVEGASDGEGCGSAFTLRLPLG